MSLFFKAFSNGPNYSYQHEDADFMVGEHVMLMVQRYDQEKLQMYGKIMSKW